MLHIIKQLHIIVIKANLKVSPEKNFFFMLLTEKELGQVFGFNKIESNQSKSAGSKKKTFPRQQKSN